MSRVNAETEHPYLRPRRSVRADRFIVSTKGVPAWPNTATAGEMKRSLTLTGVTVNAMALIAPGRVPVDDVPAPGGPDRRAATSTAPDMWTGLFFALVLALLTAYSYSELARIYPDAGTGLELLLRRGGAPRQGQGRRTASGRGSPSSRSAGSATSTTGSTRASWWPSRPRSSATSTPPSSTTA